MRCISIFDKSSFDRLNNILWIDSLHWSFKWDFENFKVGSSFISKKKCIEDLGYFFLKATKVSMEQFSIELNIDFSDRLGKGSYLECNISVSGYKNNVVVEATEEMYQVGTTFTYKHDSVNAVICTVRCVIKMYEFTCLKTEICRIQNDRYYKLIEEAKYITVEDMAYLLEYNSIGNIFSGSQSTTFAKIKVGYIGRTLEYAAEIARKVRSKNTYKPKILPEVYLGRIYGKESKPISKEEVLILYMDAHRYGLPYLVNECREYMLHNLDNEYLISVLIVSELTADTELYDKALELIKYTNNIVKSNTWEVLIREYYPIMRFLSDREVQKCHGKGKFTILIFRQLC